MITIDEIINILKKEELEESKILEVEKAYKIASSIHEGQFRESGEPYIVHPLMVAKYLLDMEIYDSDTISAALLHDTIEDAEGFFTKEDIAHLMGQEVAELVDGVTKIRRMNFSSKKEQRLANTRKIINGYTKDIRIILIKLADRLHNMKTLEYKTKEKQLENALETMELFVPLALSIGNSHLQTELEDLSLKYIEPKYFEEITKRKEEIYLSKKPYLQKLGDKIENSLYERDIPNEVGIESRNICSIYKKIKNGYEMGNIYDIFYLKIMVEKIEDCYRSLGFVHQDNRPINGRLKDFIYNPKTNYYQSLHTTVSTKEGQLIKAKIRTFDMDKIVSYGIPALWNLKDGKSKEETQREIKEKLQFAKKLIEIDKSFQDNEEFVNQIKKELLTDQVYIYTNEGETIELPIGSNAYDFVCATKKEDRKDVIGVLVNEKEVPFSYILRNDDLVQVLINSKEKAKRENEYINSYQKRKIDK